MVPAEVPKISSFLLSPSRSASTGDDSPSPGSLIGKPLIRSWSLCRYRLRRSCPVSVWPSCVEVTTTRTVNPNGSCAGRLFCLLSPPWVSVTGRASGPLKFVPDGKRDLRSETSTVPSVPSKLPVRDVEPSHQLDATRLKSPPSAALRLSGSDPGATSTTHV